MRALYDNRIYTLLRLQREIGYQDKRIPGSDGDDVMIVQLYYYIKLACFTAGYTHLSLQENWQVDELS